MSDIHILVANVFFAPYSYGGATVVAEQVARELVRQTSARVSVVSMVQDDSLVPYKPIKSQTGGIVNYIINVPRHRSYAELYDNPQVTQIVARLMDFLDPDLLHAHCIQDMGAGIFSAAKARDIPVILSVHDFWWLCDRQFMIKPDQSYCGQDPIRIEACRGCVDDFSAARTRRDYLLAQAAHIDLVTYPSRFALELSENSGFAPGKGVVWENGVRLPGPGFFEAQAARRARDGTLSFGFLGGPSQIKGWPLLRRAFSQLDRQDYRLLLVDGSLDGTWWEDVDLKTLKGDVEIYPRFSQDEMDAFYAEIDVLLFLSQWKETFGLAIREAVSRGIPVIQTDSGGTVEHAFADPSRLIPIGAGADALVSQLNAAFKQDHAGISPGTVSSFTEQALRFAELATPLIRKTKADAPEQ
ncbi:glycosyltransferase [Marimonas arenosa]|uniref:Glycosyltransferase n=1 Tax=Marimonas arenosa TaxID=1795305 RepID=A0AAE3WBQ1_9RHOB|nr:glycosyltransferase [Marimonas arenosa]MDQ2090271.1 glycosyltransferase [Marimonas arenosa]